MIFGAVIEPDMGDEVRVTVIATGFERSGVPRRALERLASGNSRLVSQPGGMAAGAPFVRQGENVSVGVDVRPGGESRAAATQPNYGGEDLDIPTFLRKRPQT